MHLPGFGGVTEFSAWPVRLLIRGFGADSRIAVDRSDFVLIALTQCTRARGQHSFQYFDTAIGWVCGQGTSEGTQQAGREWLALQYLCMDSPA